MATFPLYKVMRNSVVLSIILAILVLGLVTGCSQSTPHEPNLTPPQAIPEPSPETLPAGFFLTVTQPPDNSIIDIDKVEVRGHSTPGAVVSVNNEIAIADTRGIFAMTITLEEGPNVIEIIASDDEGNEATTSLMVTLVKGG